FVDENDSTPAPAAIPKSSTAYVYNRGKPVLFTPELFRQIEQRHEVELVGSQAISWMGAPLVAPAGTIGVLAVQDYERPDSYDERDLAFLATVGGQVALVIER